MKNNLLLSLIVVAVLSASGIMQAANTQPTKGSNSSKGCCGCSSGKCCPKR